MLSLGGVDSEEEGENGEGGGEGGEGPVDGATGEKCEAGGEKSEPVGEEGGGGGGGGGGEQGEAVSGSEHASPPLSANPVIPSASTMFSVLQVESLMRVHIMMAQLHGTGTQAHWDLTMAALGYCTIMWKVHVHVPLTLAVMVA